MCRFLPTKAHLLQIHKIAVCPSVDEFSTQHLNMLHCMLVQNALDPLSQNLGPQAVENYFCAAHLWLSLVTQFECRNSLLLLFTLQQSTHTQLSPEPPSSTSSPIVPPQAPADPHLHHCIM